MPYLIYLPPSYLNLGIYTCITIRNLLSISAYPVLLILIKDSAPSASVLGKINGLASSAGAIQCFSVTRQKKDTESEKQELVKKTEPNVAITEVEIDAA